MFPILMRFTRDEVGSTVASEFALVTGVTIGALFVSASSFTINMKSRFEAVSTSPALQVSDLEKEEEKEEQRRRDEFEQRKAAAAHKKIL